jgi:hypothetical protein
MLCFTLQEQGAIEIQAILLFMNHVLEVISQRSAANNAANKMPLIYVFENQKIAK